MSQFEEHELAGFLVSLVKAARLYQNGGANTKTGKFFFGNLVTFRNFDTITRDIGCAEEIRSRNAFMGFTIMGLCDALLILTQDGTLEIKHLKALGSPEAREELNRFFEKGNPLNNPFSGSGLYELLDKDTQLKLKESGRSEQTLHVINSALHRIIEKL